MKDRIWLVQCLCPQRHCVMALAYHPRDHGAAIAREILRARIDETLASGRMNRWCAICKSSEWHFEAGPTKFHTMKEALPHLREAEARQLLSQAILTARKEDPQ